MAKTKIVLQTYEFPIECLLKPLLLAERRCCCPARAAPWANILPDRSRGRFLELRRRPETRSVHRGALVDMLRTVRLVEQMAGEKLVHIQSNGIAGHEATDLEPAGDGMPALPLIEAVAKLQGENEALKAHNAALERRLAALEKRLN